MGSNRRQRPEQRSKEIVAAALACFAESGFAATTLDHIASRAGVGKGTIYLYFGDKRALMRAVVESALMLGVDDSPDPTEDTEVPLEESLRRTLLTWSSTISASTVSVTKVLLAEAGNFPDLVRHWSERKIELVESLLGQGIAAGEFRSDMDLKYVSFLLVAAPLLSLVWQKALKPGVLSEVPAERVVENHLDLMLRAITSKIEKHHSVPLD
jgi:AcrR family transcriptional regulator